MYIENKYWNNYIYKDKTGLTCEFYYAIDLITDLAAYHSHTGRIREIESGFSRFCVQSPYIRFIRNVSRRRYAGTGKSLRRIKNRIICLIPLS